MRSWRHIYAVDRLVDIPQQISISFISLIANIKASVETYSEIPWRMLPLSNFKLHVAAATSQFVLYNDVERARERKLQLE
jgi:hypothetical protein